MNGLKASVAELDEIIQGHGRLGGVVDLMVCPPATLVATFAKAAHGSGIAIGAQDCSPEQAGAFTGDISAEMLKDAGAVAIIVGHSERRTLHHETDGLVRKKALAVHRSGLAAIVCIGETRPEREAGRALEVVRGQLDGSLPDPANSADLIVAYEPVWAIGTGLTPSAFDIEEVHAAVRRHLIARYGSEGDAMRILYGGSVNPANAKELMAIPNVDGALVGGASLKANSFLGIAAAYA
jgi:triosephosphate isomerase